MADGAFRETTSAELLSPVTGKKGSDWDIVFLRQGWSKNGRFYAADVLKDSIPFFEKWRVCTYHLGDKFDHIPQEAVDHIGRDKLSTNMVGWFENVRYGSYTNRRGEKGEGLLARFHVLEGHKWLRDNLRDAWNHKKESLLGFSIDALGDSREGYAEGRHGEIVDKIKTAEETTVVTDPAAGGEILRLVASVQGGRGMQALYNLLKENCPHWFRGHGEPGEEDIGDYLLRIIEATTALAEEEQNDVDTSGEDDEVLKEIARGVTTLNALVKFVRAGKMDEAQKLIQEWIGGYPKTVEGTQAKEKGFFSKPYGTSPDREKQANREAGKEGEMTEAERKKKEEEAAKLEEAGHLNQKDKEKKKKEEEEEARMAALKKREAMLRVREMVVESGLAKEAQDRIVAGIESAGKFDLSDEDIEAAITSMREFVSSFSESGKVTGLGPKDNGDGSRVKVGDEQRDRWLKAFQGYWEGSGNRIDGVEPFYDIKEAWVEINKPNHHMTNRALSREVFRGIKAAFPGDEEVTGEEHRQYIRESWADARRRYRLTEATSSSTFTQLFGDSINVFLQKLTQQDPRSDYEMIVSQNLNARDYSNVLRLVRTGGFNDLPVVAENAAYQEITPTRTENEEQITPQKRGGIEKLSLEAVLADRQNEIRRIPKALAFADVRTISKDVWNQIESNPTVSGNALISGGNNNEISGSPVLSYNAVADGIQLLRDQTEQDSSEKMGLRAKYLLVGTKLESEAWEIVNSDVKVSAGEDATVASFVKSQGLVVISTLGLGRVGGTDDHFWLVADPKQVDTIGAGWLGGRRQSEIFVQSPADTPTSGEAFTSDRMTIKIRSNYVGAANFDHRYIVGSLQ